MEKKHEEFSEKTRNMKFENETEAILYEKKFNDELKKYLEKRKKELGLDTQK